MIGILSLATAAFFSVLETRYFGNNAFPHSDAEIIADGVATVAILLAVNVAMLERLFKQQRR